VDFIKTNPDWEAQITQKPYCVTVKRDGDYILLAYSQIDSDFTNDIVKECRGIILDKDYNHVCVPFFKFGNYGEGYVDAIDWKTARVQSKIDGSLIKAAFYNGEWHISTNGMIDARKAEIQSDLSPYKNFYDLFMAAAENSGLDIEKLGNGYTWMFELVSPWNRVVVSYENTELYHIGARNMTTMEEENIDIGVKKPKEYPLYSIEECVKAASELPFSEEGYVVVDANWHRNKVKSPAYAAAHHLNTGAITTARIVGILRQGTDDDFIAYFSHFKGIVEETKAKINEFCDEMDKNTVGISRDDAKKDRKGFAAMATTTMCPPFLFSWLDGRCETAREWLWQQTDEKVAYWIEKV
jgi:hypothetical protein